MSRRVAMSLVLLSLSCVWMPALADDKQPASQQASPAPQGLPIPQGLPSPKGLPTPQASPAQQASPVPQVSSPAPQASPATPAQAAPQAAPEQKESKADAKKREKAEKAEKAAADKADKAAADKAQKPEKVEKSDKKSEKAESKQADVPTQTLLELVTIKHDFKAAWGTLFKGEYSLPAWLQNLEANSPPVQPVTYEGKDFIFGQMCKTNECGNEKIICLFSSDHKKAWAVQVQVPYGLGPDGAAHPKRYATLHFYGSPDVPMKKYLMLQLAKDPAWK